jgi:Viral BACON domain
MKGTKQCLRCDNLCEEPAIFCEQCQAMLLARSLQKSSVTQLFQTAPLPDVETSADTGGETVQIAASPRTAPTAPPGITCPPAPRQRGKLSFIRKIFILLALLAVVALVVDGILVSLGFTHLTGRAGTFPMLTATPGVVHLGQVVQLHLSHFTPHAQILLTRDVQESLRTDDLPTRANATGSADLHILVEGAWEPGPHYIEAEDVSAHYTASIVLQVINAGPVLPPLLQLNASTLDMGTDWQGADTLKTLALANNGGGAVSWSSASNQPWLQAVPARGVFSASQMVTIAATRTNLKVGTYRGSIKIVSNTDTPLVIPVKMSVRPLPAHVGPVLAVTPPALSFTSIDGGSDPPEQDVTLSNPGTAPLQWSVAPGKASASVDQNIPFQANWLSVAPNAGTLVPGASMTLHVRAYAHALFPSVYSGLLTLTSRQKTFNAPQSIAVALDVQQRCGVAANVGSMSFIAAAGQHTTDAQRINVDATPGCASVTPWSAFSLADWLSVTPANGQVGAQSGTSVTVGIGADLLQAGTFTGFLVFVTEHRTQTIAVQLTVLAGLAVGQAQGQQPVSPTAPVYGTPSTQHNSNAPGTPGSATSASNPATAPRLSLSPAELTFNVTRGQMSTQQVTFANAGGGTFNWQVGTNGSLPSWLTITSAQGSLQGGQAAELTFATKTGSLATGTYRAQVVVNAVDASGRPVAGSPQVLSVILNVLLPCVLQVSPANLSFSASLLQGPPSDQSISVKATGNCSWPVSWQTSVDAGSQGWLSLSPGAGNEDGTGSTIDVHIDASGKLLGSYNGQITLSAQDATGAAITVSPSTVAVSLSVLG